LPLLGKVKTIEIRRRTQLIKHLLVSRRKRPRRQQVQITAGERKLRRKCAMVLLRLEGKRAGRCRALKRDVGRAQFKQIDCSRFREILIRWQWGSDNGPEGGLSWKGGGSWRSSGSFDTAGTSGVEEDSNCDADRQAKAPRASSRGYGVRVSYGAPRRLRKRACIIWEPAFVNRLSFLRADAEMAVLSD